MAAFFDEAADICAVCVHHVNLSIGRKCDLSSRTGIPHRRIGRAFADGEAPHVLTVPVRYIDFAVAAITACRKGDLTSIRRQCGSECISYVFFEGVSTVI